MKKIILITINILLLSGCASYGKISNHPKTNGSKDTYSIRNAVNPRRSKEVILVLSFSGGGTRAAALAYGVLQALHDTPIIFDDKSERLIDEIDLISSVSGGSFTAAYFGLNRDNFFTDYKEKFLYKNTTGELLYGLFNPWMWFSSQGRTEMAVRHYENSLFKDATFSDLYKQNGPLIVINASDIGRGVRFSFTQDYFDLICSDLSSFPVSRAVTASSAVPVLFNPVILKNYSECDTRAPEFLQQAKQYSTGAQFKFVIDGLSSYSQKEQRRFIHLVDGGITDNLGLLAIYEMVEVAGGAKRFLDYIGGKPSPHFVVISVNASTTPVLQMELSNKIPSTENTINAITDTQLHRSNAGTIDLFKNGMQEWGAEMSTPEKPVKSYFIEVNLKDISQSSRRLFFKNIPTSLSLDKKHVDELIKAGRELLFNNPEYNRFIQDIN